MHSTSEFAKIVLSKCVWNIWIDVKLLPDDVFFHCLFFSLYRYSASVCKRHGFCFCQLISCQTCYTAGGGCMVWQSSTNEDTAFQWWYDEGTPLSRTCFIFGHGMWLTQEPPCRFQTTCFQFSRLTRFSQFVKVGTSWLSWNEGSASNSLHLALAMAMVASWCFLGSFHRPTPELLSGITGVFLHVRCIPHQNLQRLFWASVWFMLDSSWWHEPFGEYLSR